MKCVTLTHENLSSYNVPVLHVVRILNAEQIATGIKMVIALNTPLKG
jgi:hypothetical protein